MCQRGFMVALNSSRLLVAGRENTQVQQASPSRYYSWGTSTWPVTFQNKSFGWTETKQCDESNFHFSIVKYATGKNRPGVGFLSEPFGMEFNCFNQDKRGEKKPIFFKNVFSDTAAQKITGINTTACTWASLERRDWKILSVSNQGRLLHTDMSAPSHYSIQ